MKAALQLSIIVLYIFPFNMCKATVKCSSLGGEAPVPVYNSPYTILENGSLCCDSYDGPTTCIEVKEVATKCAGGLVYEPCHFCQTCAKVIGETCGGNHSEYGKCDEYLECLNGTEVMDGSNGIGTCYPNATKGLGEVCGGEYGKKGRCMAGLRCNVSDTSANNEEGICLDESAPGACFKNCVGRESTYVCGDDGRNYTNKCELRKQNCLIPPGRQPYKIRPTDMSVCNQACEDVDLKHEKATVKYSNEVRNGSIAVIGCDTGFTLYPSSVTLLCTGGQWHRRVEHSDGSIKLHSDYTYLCT